MDEREGTAGRADGFLPLKAAWFQMLLTLTAGERHGYAIRREVEERTEGRIRLWPATLYGSLAKMEEAGLIEEAEPLDRPDDDIDRVFYRITELGKAVAAAETERLERLVDFSRSRLAGAGY